MPHVLHSPIAYTLQHRVLAALWVLHQRRRIRASHVLQTRGYVTAILSEPVRVTSRVPYASISSSTPVSFREKTKTKEHRGWWWCHSGRSLCRGPLREMHCARVPEGDLSIADPRGPPSLSDSASKEIYWRGSPSSLQLQPVARRPIQYLGRLRWRWKKAIESSHTPIEFDRIEQSSWPQREPNQSQS